ncbi:MAG TPA: beta-ketoacyl-ACP synthase III [Pseudomonadota bacterium]|nr:ketoacyl-ACP synthase III [Xanthomonadales bacterium]MBP6691497.1 ketoacyl-ACP synthase III [Xanthomonadales bacterium]HQW64142.1 beta-ketoacyl-ACP synthase III [Pseudomonadota bacterium]HQY35366.1 beta-ketoacyl-ACP synthase III [Pseudomonadota bacterium]HRA36504.1 beta-ketoacyl-ACP synthase III [Pseudomonadota bacterium]
MTYARIAGTGSYLPDNVLSNDELARRVDTSDEWIRTRTGIRQRHIALPGQTTGDLAFEASLRAMQAAGVVAADIDLIVLGTTTPDIIFPSTACLLQHRLGANGCAAFDVNAACSGFLYALGIANQFVRSGTSKCALVVGAETLSRMIDWSDRGTCVLFGDGAGAVVLKADDETGILSTHLHADGAHKELLYNPVGVSVGFKDEPNHGVKVMMSGNDVFKVAVKTLDAVVEETLAHHGLDRHAIDWLIPHQANLRIITATARRLDMPMERVIVTVDRHGNTSAASVPLALDEAVRSGKVKRGELLLLEAFGGGFTWGSALLRY